MRSLLHLVAIALPLAWSVQANMFLGGMVDATVGRSMDASWPAARWLEMVHAGGPWSKFISASMAQLGTYDREGQLVASMSAYACGFNYASGASVSRGLLVEFGTWAGGSMRCFAAGVNQTGHKHRAIGFDAFKAGFIKGNEQQLRGTRWWDPRKSAGEMQKLDLEPIYNWNVQDVYPTVRAKRVNFNEKKKVDKELGASALIDVFITDAAKHASTLVRDLSTAAPYLRPGSILTFSDFGFYQSANDPPHNNQILFVFGQLVDGGTLRFLGVSGSYGYFALAQIISRESVTSMLKAWKAKASTKGTCKAAKAAAIKALEAVAPNAGMYESVIPSLHALGC